MVTSVVGRVKDLQLHNYCYLNCYQNNRISK